MNRGAGKDCPPGPEVARRVESPRAVGEPCVPCGRGTDRHRGFGCCDHTPRLSGVVALEETPLVGERPAVLRTDEGHIDDRPLDRLVWSGPTPSAISSFDQASFGQDAPPVDLVDEVELPHSARVQRTRDPASVARGPGGASVSRCQDVSRMGRIHQPPLRRRGELDQGLGLWRRSRGDQCGSRWR